MRTMIVLCALALCVGCVSCAAGATANRVVLEMTSPAHDNRQAACELAEDLVPVPDSLFRMMHAKLCQGAWVAEDSLLVQVGRLARFTFWPPSGATCEATAWASDAGGSGCLVTAQAVPTVVTFKPARVKLVSY